jgi:diguanylate cyclase (GGDEF)-like protein
MQHQVQDTLLATLERLQGSAPGAHISFLVCALAILGLIWMPVAFWLANQRRALAEPNRRAELELLRSARRDPLTQLQNRVGFSEALGKRLQAGTRSAFLLIDLDGFKGINGRFGHKTGDELLVSIANRLRQLVPDAEQLGRLSGNEFGIVLDAACGRDDIEGAVLNIARAMLMPFPAGMHTLDCSASIGVALLPDHAVDEDGIMRAAQAALSEVKSAGGGAFRFYSPARCAAERVRQKLKDDLKAAIGSNQIIPYYQPIVDLRSGHMVGLEVLARWQHPERGLITPDLFIPIAEELQLAGAITQTLMRRVIRDARDWPNWVYFALNVSPGQLRELIGLLRNPPVWPEGELDPTKLEIEVTESALIEDVEVAREVIGLLQARGTRVVLDDFGIGYSNIFHLRELPFDRMKIDKSFILDSGKDPRAEACIRAMLALGNSLGIEMVAEGIETEEAARQLSELGCTFGQGYLFSEPVPAGAVYGLIRRLRQAPAEVAA